MSLVSTTKTFSITDSGQVKKGKNLFFLYKIRKNIVEKGVNFSLKKWEHRMQFKNLLFRHLDFKMATVKQ